MAHRRGTAADAQYGRRVLAIDEAIALVRMLEEKRPLTAVFRGNHQDPVQLERILLDKAFIVPTENDGRVFTPTMEISTFGGVRDGWRCYIPNPSFGRWGVRESGKFRPLHGNRFTPFQRRTGDVLDVLPNEPVYVLVLSEMN